MNMPQRFFGKTHSSRKEKPPEAMNISMNAPLCLIQIPSTHDLACMRLMPAGEAEDQKTRLTHMSERIVRHSTLPVITTDQLALTSDWHKLFLFIDEGKEKQALAKIQLMKSSDQLLQLILRVHAINYLKTIISSCIVAHHEGGHRVNSDITITPKTFELLIKDLATTLQHATSLHWSFGLPSHHAFSEEGNGFCILNKTEI